MAYGTTALTLAAVLKLQDELSQPLDTAIQGAKKHFDELSITAQRVEKIKLFDGLKAELDTLSTALVEAKKKRDFFLQSAETGGADGAKLFARDIREAKQEVLDLAAQVHAKRGTLRDLGESMRSAGLDVDHLGGQLTQLNEQLRREDGLKAFKQRVEEIGTKTAAAGRAIESVGIRLAAIGGGGQAALGQMDLDLRSLVGGAINVEKSLYGIASTAGLAGDQAKTAVTAWTGAINQIAKDTNQQQASVVEALNTLVAKGMDPKAALAMLKPIGQAATAAQADILSMAIAAEAGVSKLGIASSDTKKMLDIMAQAGKDGAFELKDMAGYFEMLTSKSEVLGIKGTAGLAQLAAAAQISRRASGDASIAANNLGNWLNKLNSNSTAKTFDKMGADLELIKQRARASGDFIGTMADEIKRLTGGDTAKIAQLFPDAEAGQFVQRLILDLDDYKRIGQDAFQAVGVSAKDFDTQMQSTSAQIDKLKISATASSGEGGGIRAILEGLNSVSAWVDAHPDLAKWLIFGSAGLAVGGAVILGIGATVTAIGTITTALSGVATFLAANPVVATLLGLAAAGAAGYAAGGYIADWIDGQVQALTGDKAATLGTALYDLIEGEGGIIQTIKGGWEKMKQAGADLIAALREGMTAALKGELGIGKKLTEAVAYLKTQTKEWLAVGGQIVDGIIQGIKAKAQAMWDEVKALGKGALKAIRDALDIHSPSRQFFLVGEMAGEGMKAGILAKVKDVHAAAKKLGEQALYGAKDKLTADWLKATLADEAALWKEWSADQTKVAEAAQRAAESLANSLRTPFERAAEDMAGYEKMLADGTITWEVYSRAVMKTMDGIETGSQGAAKAVDAAGKSIAKTFRDSKGRFLPADEALRAAEEWDRAAEDINRSLTDALMRGFENGRGFLDSLASTIVSTFNTMVLRPIVQAVVQPIGGAVASMFMPGMASASGLGGGSSLANYASAGGGSALGAINNASSLANLFSMGGNTWNMLSATAGGLFNGTTSLGAILGSTGSMISTAATYGTAIGSAQTAMLAAQEAGLAASSTIAGSIGSALSSIPVWGWIAAGILGAFGSSIFGGEVKVFDQGLDLSVKGADASGRSYTQYKESGGWFGDSSYWTNYSAVDLSGMDASLGQVAKLLTQIGGEDAAARLAKYTASYKGAASGVDAWMKTVLDGMVRTALPQLWDAFRRTGEEVDATLQRLAATLDTAAAIRAALGTDIDVLSGTMTAAAAQSRQATESISKLTGLLADTSDIQTRVELEGQLHQAVMSRYQLEQQYLASLSQTLQQVAASLAQVRGSVAASALEINPLAVPTAAQLRESIASAGSGLSLPSMTAVLAESDRYSAAQSAEQRLAGLETENASDVRSLQASVASLYQIAVKHGVYLNARSGPIELSNTAYAYNQETNRLAGYGQMTYTNNLSQATAFKADAEGKALIASLSKGNQILAANSAAMAIEEQLIASLGGSAGAQEALTLAQQHYADAILAYAGDATQAIATLEALRSETMRYYQAQDALAKLMATSAGRLRDEIGKGRASMLGQAGQLGDVRGQFDRAYALAGSTSGAVLAGYADQLSTLLPGLVAGLADQSATRADWQRQAGRALAQAEAIAARVDAQAPAGYEAEALALLSGIDLGLTNLQTGLQTADQQIVAAIEASKSATVDVLVQIRDHLGATLGTTLPGHADGLPWVPYDDYTARLHAGEAVVDAATMSGLRRYGIPVRGGQGGQDNAALLAELRGLRAEVNGLRAETRATVSHTAKTARLLDRAMPDGDALATRVAA